MLQLTELQIPTSANVLSLLVNAAFCIVPLSLQQTLVLAITQGSMHVYIARYGHQKGHQGYFTVVAGSSVEVHMYYIYEDLSMGKYYENNSAKYCNKLSLCITMDPRVFHLREQHRLG